MNRPRTDLDTFPSALTLSDLAPLNGSKHENRLRAQLGVCLPELARTALTLKGRLGKGIVMLDLRYPQNPSFEVELLSFRKPVPVRYLTPNMLMRAIATGSAPERELIRMQQFFDQPLPASIFGVMIVLPSGRAFYTSLAHPES